MKTKYLVEVQYQTTAGNPASKRKVIAAHSSGQAIDFAIAQVMALKTCMKVIGGNVMEDAGIPEFGWGLEDARIFERREKAIEYIYQHVKPLDIDESSLIVPLDGTDIMFWSEGLKGIAVTEGYDGEDLQVDEMKRLTDLHSCQIIRCAAMLEFYLSGH